ncbi:MAG: hypothetical protein KF814_08530 [Nitrospiraceae bacterium]|nr:hypothetical protein [Nitrospiraceae bacterium]
MSVRPVRTAGWAFSLSDLCFLRWLSLNRLYGVTLALLLCLLPAEGLWADSGHASPDGAATHGHADAHHDHHGAGGGESGWEGSAQGIAYSEFNHHLAGFLVLLIGLSELRQALRLQAFAWSRFLLPGAMLTGGIFLLIWSDHEAWPIGSMTFAQTFSGADPEIIQHKTYGWLCLFVGTVECLKRVGRFQHAAWTVPLPLFAIVGGLMLFGHSHGDHPSAHKIALHHAVMGTLAITAGSSRLLSGWRAAELTDDRSYWELIWAALILVIGLQLLIYSE